MYEFVCACIYVKCQYITLYTNTANKKCSYPFIYPFINGLTKQKLNKHDVRQGYRTSISICLCVAVVVALHLHMSHYYYRISLLFLFFCIVIQQHKKKNVTTFVF